MEDNMKRRCTVLTCSLVPLLFLGAVPSPSTGVSFMTIAAASPAAPAAPTTTQDHARDFDFLMGKWKIRNRMLTARLKGSADWVEYDATCAARPILAGTGNEDEYRTEHWPGFVGMSFRFYNPKTGIWSIYWTSSRNAIGVLEPPVMGNFANGRGVFEGPDTFEGRPIVVRYIWSRVDTPTPRWEQAFSGDGGKTWETNWIMDFTRAE
jgi:hypothetical protein